MSKLITSTAKHYVGVLFIVISTALIGCGGGGGGGSSPDLSGTWSDGIFEINISGLIVTSVIDNGIDLGWTGTITRKSNQAYSATFNDGFSTFNAVILTDSPVNHIGIAFDELPIVLQRSVIANSNYLIDEIDGGWSGVGAETDDYVNFTTGTVSVSCQTLTCLMTANTGESLTAFFTSTFDPLFGYWGGVFTDTLGNNGSIEAAMSMDKSFAMVINCDLLGPFPFKCTFFAWER